MAITDETSMNYTSRAFWSKQASELLQKLESTPHGLTTEDAQKRLLRFGENRLKAKKRSDAFSLNLSPISYCPDHFFVAKPKDG
jgi:magnesium-transporting ATPase (P-type)